MGSILKKNTPGARLLLLISLALLFAMPGLSQGDRGILDSRRCSAREEHSRRR